MLSALIARAIALLEARLARVDAELARLTRPRCARTRQTKKL
jgi:hypothetical protein